jgi:hypothetical protein
MFANTKKWLFREQCVRDEIASPMITQPPAQTQATAISAPLPEARA